MVEIKEWKRVDTKLALYTQQKIFSHLLKGFLIEHKAGAKLVARDAFYKDIRLDGKSAENLILKNEELGNIILKIINIKGVDWIWVKSQSHILIRLSPSIDSKNYRTVKQTIREIETVVENKTENLSHLQVV